MKKYQVKPELEQIANILVKRYCEKCLNPIEEGRFCCDECRRDYYLEINQDNDDNYGEYTRRD